MSVESHPLRITERDVIKEQSVDEWFNSFKGLDLHIRVRVIRKWKNLIMQQASFCAAEGGKGGLPAGVAALTCQAVPACHAPKSQNHMHANTIRSARNVVYHLPAFASTPKLQVLHARDLSPNGGLPDPYCKIMCGPATHQTATQRR